MSPFANFPHLLPDITIEIAFYASADRLYWKFLKDHNLENLFLIKLNFSNLVGQAKKISIKRFVSHSHGH